MKTNTSSQTSSSNDGSKKKGMKRCWWCVWRRGTLRRRSSVLPIEPTHRDSITSTVTSSFISRVRRDETDDLQALIQKHKWDDFNVILSRMKRDDFARKEFESFRDCNGSNYLHLVCRQSPPLEEVVEILDLCPGLVHEVDSRNRTPLHIASTYHLSPNIIRHLIHLHPKARHIQDCNGKTPLILACDNNVKDFSSCHNDYEVKEVIRSIEKRRYHQVTKELIRSLDGTCTGAHITDDDDANALEYAIGAGADVATINLLQRVTSEESKLSFRRRKCEH